MVHLKKFKKGWLYLRGETRSIWFVLADTKLQIWQGYLESQFQTSYLIANTKNICTCRYRSIIFVSGQIQRGF